MFASPLFWQIQFLVSNLRSKSLKSNVAELSQLVDLYGQDAQVFLLQCLVEHVDLKDEGDKGKKENGGKDSAQSRGLVLQLLQHQISKAANQANFASLLCQALTLGTLSRGVQLGCEYLESFGRVLKLTLAQQITVAVSLAQAPVSVAAEALQFLLRKLPELAVGGSATQLPEQVLHSLIGLLAPQEHKIQIEKALEQVRASQRDLISSGPEEGGEGGVDGGQGQRLCLRPLFVKGGASVAAGEMNYLNETSRAMSLGKDMSVIAGSISATSSLSAFLCDLGASCSMTVPAFRQAVVASGLVVAEEQVAQLLAMLSRSYKQRTGAEAADLSATLTSSLLASAGGAGGGGAGEGVKEGAGQGEAWDLDVVRQVLTEDYGSRLDWNRVALAFDHEGFLVPEQGELGVLLGLYRACSKADLPPEAMFGRWANRKGHLSLLKACVAAPSQLYSFAASPNKQPLLEGTDPAVTPNEAWLSLDLMTALLRLAQDTELYMGVRDILTVPAYKCPEVLLLALASLSPEVGGKLRSEMLARLLPLYFRPNRNLQAAALIRRLFRVNPVMLKHSCQEAASIDSSLTTIQYVLGIMHLVPESRSLLLGGSGLFEISLASALFGSEKPPQEQQQQQQQQLFDLEAWASDRLSQASSPLEKEALGAAVLNFINKNVGQSKPRSQAQALLQQNLTNEPCTMPTVALSVEALAGFLRALSGAGFAQSNQQLYAALQQVTEGAQSMLPPLAALLNSEDVEEKANSCFQRIYKGEQSIEDVMVMLKRFKSSSLAQEQEIFACMVHNLFDEYRFFHKYPERELRITGILFGTLIQHQLVSSVNLGIALRYVLEALRKDPEDQGGKMLRFGMFALEQFKSRLHEWPQYCSHIIQIDHLEKNHPELVREIERAMQGQGQGHPRGPGAGVAPTDRELDPKELRDTGQVTSKVLGAGEIDLGQGSELSASPGQQQHRLPPPLPSDSGLGVGTSGSSFLLGGMPGVLPVGVEEPRLQLQQQQQQQLKMEQSPNAMLQGLQQSPLPSMSLALSPASEANTGPPLVPAPRQRLPGQLGQPDIDAIMEISQPGGLLETEPSPAVPPPDKVMDQFHFVINNVSPTNLEDKVKEVRPILEKQPEFAGWVANYLVVKRISTQPNFHSLYLQFVDRMESRELMDAIVKSVFFNVGKLLRSHKIITSTQERSLLKNLGSWLGQTTLARNKPILQSQLNLKELLLQGYETGFLIAVTPFIAKILEGAKSSRVFCPPNPWIMGLLGALHEMYSLTDLKMNIKFEVEMLVKKLNIKLEDVPKSGKLAMRLSPQKEKNPDFNVKNSLTTPPVGPARQPGTKDEGAAGAAAAASLPADGSDTLMEATVIPNLAAYVTVNPNLGLLPYQQRLKRVVPLAVDRAIRDIIQPVVERSVTIACITTKELVTKDFAMEPDEQKMRMAAHGMVSNLAGSLALVTCKEPLRVSIGNNMRALLQQQSVEVDSGTLEQVVLMCSQDNLELGCMLIEKAATEKAMRDIDESLGPAFATRRKHRETTGQAYYDMSIFLSSNYPAALPEPLRPKPGGLQQQQLVVYEAFQRVPRQPPPPAASAASSSALGDRQGSPTPGAAGVRDANSPEVAVRLESAQALQAWQGAMTRLDLAVQGVLNQAAAAGRAGELSLNVVGGDAEISNALHEVLAISNKVPEHGVLREDVLVQFSQMVFKRLFELAAGKEGSPAEVPLLKVEVYVTVLELCLRDVKKYSREELITRWYTQQSPVPMVGEGERKLQKAALTMFIRAKMIKISEVEVYIAHNMASPLMHEKPAVASAWAEFGMSLVRQCVFDHTTQAAIGIDTKALIKDFAHVLDALSKVSVKLPGVKKLFDKLMVDLRAVASQPSPAIAAPAAAASPADFTMPAGQQHPQEHLLRQQQQQQLRAGPGPQQQVLSPPMLPLDHPSAQSSTDATVEKIKAISHGDPPGSREKVTQLLEYWIRLCNERPGDEKAYAPYLQLLKQQGAIKNDEATERFLRIASELVVEASLKTAKDVEGEQTQQLSYAVVDAYANLLVLLVKSIRASDHQASTNGRVAMLSKVLSIFLRVLLNDYELHRHGVRPGPFDQRPYFRVLLCLLQDLNVPDRVLDNSNLQVLAAFASAFHALRPSVCPCFAFAWLDLISHRVFMPQLLLAKQQKGWMLMHSLLIDLFSFMEPFLRNIKLNESIRMLYKGMLRVLLLVLHDFPEFLCEFHFTLCDAIPPSCIQLRNLVLSAFPRSMRLPDPFTPNLKVDLLPEISQAPRILSDYQRPLGNMRLDINKYLQSRHPQRFLHELPSRLMLQGARKGEAGIAYDVSLINALVFYVGSQAIVQVQNKAPAIAHSAPMDIFQHLVNTLDSEGRYFLLNAIANQLRYPNSHTHYFSCVLLYLFAEAQADIIQEQITRILLERLIVHRPHPWGLLITFIELIKNPRYSFWNHGFTQSAPELERVFESVARSCMSPGGHSGGHVNAEGELGLSLPSEGQSP
ncbi:unnamed protein product [Chrysoparadoxa australica]